jgi:hypothetical protein
MPLTNKQAGRRLLAPLLTYVANAEMVRFLGYSGLMPDGSAIVFGPHNRHPLRRDGYLLKSPICSQFRSAVTDAEGKCWCRNATRNVRTGVAGLARRLGCVQPRGACRVR